MKSKLLLVVCALFPIAISSISVPPELLSSLIYEKLLATFKSLPTPIYYPHVTDSTGKWINVHPNWWTSGFLPATGYLLNARENLCKSKSSKGVWLALGRSSSIGLVKLEAHHSIGHDIGFISFPFVEELAVNPRNQTARDAVNRFANMLAARFDPIIGCTRSWNQTKTGIPVIIDNMMNLELLFHSANMTGNSTLRRIATSHANLTMKNHIRADGSTWHIVEYNATTGKVNRKYTAQGYSNDSTWARGQSWAIYGFANMYRLTGITAYLETSRRLATWFINHMPSDGIVPWDFNAPIHPLRPADTSAATIAACGLLLLAQQETNKVSRHHWKDHALYLLSNATRFGWKPKWQSLLSNGTANRPANSYSTGIIYGDYYFIKAGNDLISMGASGCTTNAVTHVQQQSSAQRLRVPSQLSFRTRISGSLLSFLFGFWVLDPWLLSYES